ncbi:MAG: cryptochrome/photolyase family protein [Actinomycetota bacterium]
MGSQTSALVVFTRDLRVHDHPALRAGAAAGAVVPLFVFDEAILRSRFNQPNRTRYLLEALADLDASLRDRGGRLLTRRGAWVDEVLGAARIASADTVHVSDDVTPFARARLDALEAAATGTGIAVHRHPGTTVVAPGALETGSGGHFQVFTPYYRRWLETPRRPVLGAPETVNVPHALTHTPLPDLADLVTGDPSPEVVAGGETAARAALNAWVRRHLVEYGERHDDLPGDATSRVSAALRFGCMSPAEMEHRLRNRPGAEPFVRQLCWRDFYAQALLARPDAAWGDYRARGDEWNADPERFRAWTEGRTGYPVVDAAMRQLRREGFMHNRARMIVASFLTKDLYVDWRLGARHFLDWLVDGEIANNSLNWQWTAGTGTDTNPHRIFNPTVQGQRFDPEGEYVRRYVPELSSVVGKAVHEPWKLPADVRATLDYPEPIVDHRAAVAEYKDRQAELSARRRNAAS